MANIINTNSFSLVPEWNIVKRGADGISLFIQTKDIRSGERVTLAIHDAAAADDFIKKIGDTNITGLRLTTAGNMRVGNYGTKFLNATGTIRVQALATAGNKAVAK